MCFSLDYIPSGFGATSSDGIQRLEKDVKDADKLYAQAEKEEDEAQARLARWQGIDAGLIQATADDSDILKKGEDKLTKAADAAGNKRRKSRAKLEKRIKARDAATELKNDNVEKKDGQIYFDGLIYTTRWSCLPE